jgi:acyl transferase domain-containing protein/phosphopantetheinyl transferase (holo-ACP synthase)
MNPRSVISLGGARNGHSKNAQLGSNASAQPAVPASATTEPPEPPTPIAIIGMACMFARAANLEAFWNNILGGVDAVGEPMPQWDAQRYLDAGRIKTQHGGFLRELYRFDPREFGIMPNSIDGGEPDQYLALKVARDALLDAGYLGHDGGRHDHRDTGIILGHSTYLHRGQVTVVQTDIVVDQTIALLRAALPQLDDAQIAEIRAMLAKKIPPMNADTAPGLVPNVMTGRIANRLDLHGPNYLVDAACSSSLLAVGAAIDELRAGRSRMMLAGGVNASLPADVTTIFTQLGALSGRGKVRPFEAGSDGTLLGEGLGVIVLKRLPDALSDGDRIYAVLRGVGQSSDGRGTGLLAPSLDGEALAIRRTYDASGVDPSTVGLVEAHGTGIPLGDKTEIASLKAVFGGRTTPIGVKALGSVKSMISHCIPAAGVASLIKTSLAIHHKTLPPTLCERVNPELGIEGTPFYVNTKAAPWMVREGAARRAGVNAFGFGGTNSHAILEEPPMQARRQPQLTRWPAELCVWSAPTKDALHAKLEATSKALAANPAWSIAEVAAALAAEETAKAQRLTIVAKDTAALAKSIDNARMRLLKDDAPNWTARGGIAYARERIDGKLAFLFPGEGSQYLGMFADLAPCFDDIRRWLDFWHGLYGLPLGHTRTDIVFPSSEIDAERRKELEARLHEMDVGSESVFIGGMAMHDLLVTLGVAPDVMLGHSSGESAALGASRANPATSAVDRTACIAKHYAVYERLLAEGKIPVGALLAVGALPIATVEEQVQASPGVVIAMDNCSNQTVLYGTKQAIDGIHRRLASLGGICLPVPFDRGYHTRDFAACGEAFLDYYKDVKLGVPKVPMYSCASADLFPNTVAGVRRLAAAQWSHKVRFRETILKMHDDGVRMFVEVGPSAKLTAFVDDILIDRDRVALPTNIRRKGEVEQLLSTLGQLHVAGRGPTLGKLFEGRRIRAIDLDGVEPPSREQVLDNTLPMLRLDAGDEVRLRALVDAARAGKVLAGSSTGTAMLMDEASHAPAATQAPEAALAVDLAAASLPSGALTPPAEPAEAPAAAPWSSSTWASTHARPSPTPLLDRIVEMKPDHLVAACRVSLQNDNFIRDHVMSGPVTGTDPDLFGLACVPFAVSLEAMAEACAVLAGHTAVAVIENVKAFDWASLDDGELELEIRARVVDRAAGRFAAQVSTPQGPTISAEYVFHADVHSTPHPAWRLPGVAPLAEPRESYLNHPHLYATGMFHGPVFQSMRYVQAWDHAGIDVELSPVSLTDFFAPGHVPQLVLNPVLLDAMGQVVACWLVQYVGTEFHAFPSTIDRLELYEHCPADHEGLVLRMRQHPVDGVSTAVQTPRAWSFECSDGEGRVLMRGENLVNLFFRVPVEYHDARTDPLEGRIGKPIAPPDADTSSWPTSLWRVALMPDEFCAQSGSIGLRILAHAVLARSERDAWRALQSVPLRRRREWLFGRIAVKEAVREWVAQQTGTLLYPSDVVVAQDAHGAPFVAGWWTDGLIAAPQVSLAHDATFALAAVCADERIGVDLEAYGRIREPRLVHDALAPVEQALLQGLEAASRDRALLHLWCAKEAAAKCLGLGMQGRPHDFVVDAADDALEALRVSHPQGVFDAQVMGDDTHVVAVALTAFEATADLDGRA